MNIEEKVKDIVADVLGADPNEVKPEMNVMEDLGADSLDCMEITIKAESEFNISVTDEEFDKLKNVQDLVELIKAKTGK